MSSNKMINTTLEGIKNYGIQENHPDAYYKDNVSMNTALSMNNAYDMADKGLINEKEVPIAASLLSNIPDTNTLADATQFDYAMRSNDLNTTPQIVQPKDQVVPDSVDSDGKKIKNVITNDDYKEQLKAPAPRTLAPGSDYDAPEITNTSSTQTNTSSTQAQINTPVNQSANTLFYNKNNTNYTGGQNVGDQDLNKNKLAAQFKAKQLGLTTNPITKKWVDAKGDTYEQKINTEFYYDQAYDQNLNLVTDVLKSKEVAGPKVLIKKKAEKTHSGRAYKIKNSFKPKPLKGSYTEDVLTSFFANRKIDKTSADYGSYKQLYKEYDSLKKQLDDDEVANKDVIKANLETVANKIKTIPGFEAVNIEEYYNQIKNDIDETFTSSSVLGIPGKILIKEDGTYAAISGVRGSKTQDGIIMQGRDINDNKYYGMHIEVDGITQQLWITPAEYNKRNLDTMFQSYVNNGYMFKANTGKVNTVLRKKNLDKSNKQKAKESVNVELHELSNLFKEMDSSLTNEQKFKLIEEKKNINLEEDKYKEFKKNPVLYAQNTMFNKRQELDNNNVDESIEVMSKYSNPTNFKLKVNPKKINGKTINTTNVQIKVGGFNGGQPVNVTIIGKNGNDKNFILDIGYFKDDETFKNALLKKLKQGNENVLDIVEENTIIK